jgi:hypothetical protein
LPGGDRSGGWFGETAVMAFGQQAGPPASARQLQELLALIRDAGHVDFRDARGPLGFNQRQAAGRFTSEEAAALIDQLQEAAVTSAEPPPSRSFATDRVLRGIPSEQLAAELRRRGWLVTPGTEDTSELS